MELGGTGWFDLIGKENPLKAAWVLMFAWGVSRVALGATEDGDEKKPTPPGDAESSSSERIDRLEKEIQALKAAEVARQSGVPAAMSLNSTPPQAANASGADWGVSFTDGFHLRSSDGAFDLHIGGRVELNYREIFDRPIVSIAGPAFNAGRIWPNTYYFHEVFIAVDGTIWKDWGFKVDGDFSPQGANGNIPSPSGVSGAIPEQAWLEYKRFNEFRLQFGQFKSPNEAESIESPLFQELVNRSPMSRFVENWEVGIMAYGSIMESLFTYQIALMDGRGALANSGRSLVDDNDGKELDARFTLAPFVGDKESFLKGLRVGVWGSDAREGQGSPLASAAHPGTNVIGFPPPTVGFQSTDLFVSYMVFGNSLAAFHGARVREGAELTYAVGPFEFRGEVMQRRDQFFMTGGTSVLDYGTLGMKGYYGQVSYIVTGEDKIPDARISPAHPFDPANGGWGALELAARFGGVSFDQAKLNEMFNGNANFAGNTNRITSLAAGFNWWFTKNTKLAFDYIAEHYYDSLFLGLEQRKHLNGFLAQAQIDF